jgi:formate C-acetyltransferase
MSIFDFRFRTEREAIGNRQSAIGIPGVPEPLSLRLPPDLAALCEEALTLHQEKGTAPFLIPELTLSDARAWAAHTEAEDWLIWRARRCAERLRNMPLDLEPGERIVGKPRFRDPGQEEKAQLEAAQRVLATMPPFPGGDAGHFHPDYEKLFRLGIHGMLREIDELQIRSRKSSFYDACRIALEGLSAYIRRVADGCEQMARGDGHSAEWLRLAAICRRVATEPPATFHEAIQLMYLTLVALWFGEDHGLTCPGRLDQTLRPFYEADLAAGRLTRQEAFELICCLYIQVNRLLGTGLALAVLVGGRDGRGRDVTNELTYLCLAGRLATKLSYPTVGLAWHEGTPPELMDTCVRMLAHGRGDPAFFNDELIAAGLRDHGVSAEDSYNYMNSTCVEIKAVGRSNMWVTQPYFNLAQGLMDVMEAVAGGNLPEPPTFEALAGLVRGNLAARVRTAAEQLDRVWWARPERGGFPLASCFTHDCLERGEDFDRGGARYNWVENSFVGLANLADSLVAVRHLVYETGELTLAQFYEILARDFEGHERLRQYILNRLPKYGNDDPAADRLAAEWADFLIATTESNRVGPHRYVPGFFCWIQHERMGSQTLATPDGRRAFWPLADGAGAGQGREKCGPTASILSTTGWSHRQALGGLVQNIKFPGDLLRCAADQAALRDLIETYLRRGGFEIQVNVVSQETLLAAREHPEQYRDLLVRVAGYSDYFVKLEPKMQEEIIARTEHGL